MFTDPAYVDSPLACLRRLLPDVQIDYFDYLPRKKPDAMLWHTFTQQMPGIRDYDLGSSSSFVLRPPACPMLS